MGRLSIPPLISVLGNLNTIRGRKTIIRLLIDVGQKDINLLMSGVNDTKWYVVRNILYVLKHIKDPSAKDSIVKCLRHTDARVKREAVRTLAELKDSADINIFKDALMDPDMSVRTAAVHAISRIPSQLSKEVIFGEIKKKSFSEKPFEEKRVFFEALSKWHDEDVVEFLLKRLKKRSLFKRNITENILLSVYSLGLMHEKKALRDIEKIKNTKDSVLKEYAETAIKRIIHER
jgi:HEAT repeat protein